MVATIQQGRFSLGRERERVLRGGLFLGWGKIASDVGACVRTLTGSGGWGREAAGGLYKGKAASITNGGDVALEGVLVLTLRL